MGGTGDWPPGTQVVDQRIFWTASHVFLPPSSVNGSEKSMNKFVLWVLSALGKYWIAIVSGEMFTPHKILQGKSHTSVTLARLVTAPEINSDS